MVAPGGNIGMSRADKGNPRASRKKHCIREFAALALDAFLAKYREK